MDFSTTSTPDLSMPVKPVLVLSNGVRVGVELRYHHSEPGVYGRVFEVVVEGDLSKMMPMVVAFDADFFPPRCSVKFPVMHGFSLSQEWLQRLIDNSPKLKRGKVAGKELRKND